MITFERAEREWKFNPLPVSATTAKLFSSMNALKKDSRDMEAISDLLTALPPSIAKSMGPHHSEEEVNDFIDTILLDFGNPQALEVLGDLYKLFMGIDPEATREPKQSPA